MLPEHAGRIRGAPLDLSLSDLREKLERKFFYFSPVEALTLKDVWVVEGALYHRKTHLQFRHMHVKRLGILPFGPVADLDCAALASTMMGMRWWGHWVLDDIPYQMLAERFGCPVMCPRPLYYHEPGLRSALGIPSPGHYGVIRCKEMVVCTEHAINPDKTRRFAEIRSRLAHLPVGHRRVYIRRGDWGKRRSLVNEDVLVERLQRHGFVVVDTKGCSVDEIIANCKGAETVVGIEGSHLVLALLSMQHEGKVILLNPPYRVDTILADFGLFFGLRAGMFICEPEGNSTTDFRADPEELIRFIDYVEAKLKGERGRMDEFLGEVMRQGQ
jgi:predicted RNA binding protein YcfA (HicA-like mRNA interferase family)